MYNFLSDMDLQTRPLKSRLHFLAMTSSPAGRCLWSGDSRPPSKLVDHLTMVCEVAAINPCQSARFVEQPTSRTIRLPLRGASDDRSHAIRLKVFSPLLLRQKAATVWNGRKRHSKMVQMVREISPCGFDAYAIISGSSANGCSLLTPKRSVDPANPRGQKTGSSWKCAFCRCQATETSAVWRGGQG